jgi:rfaE bifunctional protein kinase chain/domain
MDRQKLEYVLKKVQSVSVLVVGDFFLDKYFEIDRSLDEVSIETGLTAYQVVGKRSAPGAAGVVTANLKAIGVGEVICLGVVGKDGEGFELKCGLVDVGARTDAMIESGEVFTPTYMKPLVKEGNGRFSEMSRLDIKNRKPMPRDIEDELIDRLKVLLAGVDGVAVSDQVQERNCGVITDRVRDEIAGLAGEGKFVLVDSRVRIGEFRRAAVKPNSFEAARAVGLGFDGEPTLEQAKSAGVALAEKVGSTVFVTVGAQGMVVCDGGGAVHVPGRMVEGEIDIVGAGDSSLAGIMAARCSGLDLVDSAAMGNLVASVTVTKIGETGTASPDELRAVCD